MIRVGTPNRLGSVEWGERQVKSVPLRGGRAEVLVSSYYHAQDILISGNERSPVNG